MISKMKVAMGFALMASTVSGIGQTLDGQPVGHQELKDVEHTAVTAQIDPHTGKAQPHEKISDYDTFIKQQTSPQKAGPSTPPPPKQHHEQSTTASQTASSATQSSSTHTTEHEQHTQTVATSSTTQTSQTHHAEAVVEKAQHPKHPEPASSSTDQSGFSARHAAKEAKRQEELKHQQLIDKYLAAATAANQERRNDIIAPLTGQKVSKRNAAPIMESTVSADGEERLPRTFKTASSLRNISSTQAMFVGILILVLLIIALIVFLVSWVANIMANMQRKHEAQMMELTRQNSQLRGDLEGQPGQGKDPKLLKERSAKKQEAYGRFEDEIQISREENFDQAEDGQKRDNRII